jgi:hypothetical protein
MVCRAAGGACDTEEQCTGTAAGCPPDEKSTAVCRTAAGACDVAESCDGATDACPPDLFAPAGTLCRAALQQCDSAEHCDGAAAVCPADELQADGAPCNDGDGCSGPDVCQAGTCVGATNGACRDHFLCYRVKATAPFAAVEGVRLVDEFADVRVDAVKPARLCTPTDEDGQGAYDPVTRLEGYQTKPAAGEAKEPKRSGIRMVNALGSLSLDLGPADLLLVPSTIAVAAPPPAATAHDVDHYKCYRAKITPGTPKLPKGLQATLANDFTPPKVFDVKTPKRLCVPVDKNGEGIKSGDAYAVCYQAKPAKGQPKHAKVLDVRVANQFGPGAQTVLPESELCVPSTRDPS